MNSSRPHRHHAGPGTGLLLFVALLALTPGRAVAQDSLTLEQARETLRANNPNFDIAARTLEQTALLERQARAILLPFVNLTGQYVLNDNEVTFDFPNVYAPLSPYLETVFDQSPELRDFFAENPDVPDARQLAQAEGEPAVVQYRHELRAIGTVRQTLFNARALPLLRLAELAQRQAAAGRDVLAHELDAAVIDLYFTALSLQKMAEVATRSAELAELAAEQARAAFEEGVGQRFEATRAEVSLRRAVRERDAASQGYRIAIDALATLLHRAPDFDVVSPTAPDALPSLDHLQTALGERRADLRLLDARSDFEEMRVREARARLAPEFFAQFQTILQRSSAFTSGALGWSLTLQASWDIFDGGMRGVDRREAELESLKIAHERDDLHARLVGELRQGLQALESERLDLRAAADEAELARANLELTMQARALGVASAADVELARNQAHLGGLAEAIAELAVLHRQYRLSHAAGMLPVLNRP